MNVHRMLVVVLVLVAVPLLLAHSGDERRFSDWSEPAHLGNTVNSPFGDFFPSISKDELSLYFTSSRPGGYGGWDMYVSQRESVRDPWGEPRNLGNTINTASNEGAPFLDGHRLYFASDRPGGYGGNDIYVARLDRRHHKDHDLAWRAAENLGEGVNTLAHESHPTLFDDEKTGRTTLYFDSNRAGGPGPFTDDGARNGNDIYASTLRRDEDERDEDEEDEDDTFGPAALVAELSTPFLDRQPAVRRDGLEIFLSSNRTGTFGFLDLWVSRRARTSDPWSVPINLGDVVNGPGSDAGPALSVRGTTLYFQAPPPGGGAFDLYVTTRRKLRGRDEDHDK